jgi:type III pantothenate kinase
MQPKLLLFDIGNTAVKIGLADGRCVLSSYTLRADAGQTADSLGLTLLSVLGHASVVPDSLDACIVSSVVPVFDPLLREAAARYIGRPLYRVPEDMPVALDNRYERPAEVGADRLVGAFAARRLYPGADSLIVVDFGTAVTFDCVSGQAYLGGLIFPGPLTAMTALSREAAKLPRVNLDVCAHTLEMGRDTATSIQHGLIFGFVSVVEGLTRRLARRLPGKTLVLGTGGFAESIAGVSQVFDHVLPALLLEGLRLLYYDRQSVSWADG